MFLIPPTNFSEFIFELFSRVRFFFKFLSRKRFVKHRQKNKNPRLMMALMHH
jgi:hypothetical protein